MKKIIATLCLVAILASTVLYGFSFAVLADEPHNDYESDRDAALVAALIGTWKGESWMGTTIYVFREDGTVLSGSPGMRSESTWWIEDGSIHRSSGSFRYTLRNDVLTVRHPVRTRISSEYTFYSEATDLYEAEDWVFMIATLLVVGVAAIVIIVRKPWKRRRQSKPKHTL